MKSLSASLTHYCLSKHNAGAGETKKRSGGVTLGTLFPHIRSRPNFGTNSGDAQSSQSPAPGCETLTHSKRRAQISWTHTCWQNYPVVPEQIKANLQLRSSLLKSFFFFVTTEQQPIDLQPLFSHCSQDSTQALLWRCIFLHWFQYRSGWTSLCHATSADNKRERGTEGEGGGEIGGCLGNRSPFCNCALLISWKCSGVHGSAL